MKSTGAVSSRCACCRSQKGLSAADRRRCRCALCLLKEDAGELLRRLAIICLEDAVLHPGLPLVVWLMAAVSKVPAPPCDVTTAAAQACRQVALRTWLRYGCTSAAVRHVW